MLNNKDFFQVYLVKYYYNCTFDNVVKTTVLLADINDFSAVNAEYTKFFKSNYPARAAYQVCKIGHQKCK